MVRLRKALWTLRLSIPTSRRYRCWPLVLRRLFVVVPVLSSVELEHDCGLSKKTG